jgi:exodeoxyribonuclease VII large subunit
VCPLSDATLFEDPAERPAGEPTFSVRELNQAIAEALGETFPREVWVRGEIQQLRRAQTGHAYFQLAEKDGNRDHVRAVISVALFKNDRTAVNRSLRETPGVKITDGVEVRIRGRVDYYPPAGRLTFVMTGIDPVFTVGKLAADRDRVLRALATEGLLRKNAELELPLVPLRIGLITSGGSAAYGDFVHELESSGHAFHVVHADVRVQGAGAWRRIVFALRRLAEVEPDVVVVIRGGGARSDLAPFDAEPVARAIAGMPVPVITGIGHEVDRTIADEVAHTCCKTPTAAAALLVGEVDACLDRIARYAHRVSLRARSACAMATRELADVSRRINRGVPVALARERALLDARRGQTVDAARRGTRRHLEHIDNVEARVRALDPRRVLERGYTITRDGSGRVLRSAGAVAAGDVLVTETADGSVESTVTAEEERPGKRRRVPRRRADPTGGAEGDAP